MKRAIDLFLQLLFPSQKRYTRSISNEIKYAHWPLMGITLSLGSDRFFAAVWEQSDFLLRKFLVGPS